MSLRKLRGLVEEDVMRILVSHVLHRLHCVGQAGVLPLRRKALWMWPLSSSLARPVARRRASTFLSADFLVASLKGWIYSAAEEGTARMKRAALYSRVSTYDQNPQTQILDLRQMAAQRGYTIVKEYTDKISGLKDSTSVEIRWSWITSPSNETVSMARVSVRSPKATASQRLLCNECFESSRPRHKGLKRSIRLPEPGHYDL
jgi:hypothetical protein